MGSRLKSNKITRNMSLLAFAVAVATIMAFSLPAGVNGHGDEEGELVAYKTTSVITLDGKADETAWGDATAIAYAVPDNVQPGPKGDVTIKALYDENNLYMLFVWEDATNTESSWVSGWVYDTEGNDTDNYDNGSFEHIANANPDIYDEAEEDRLAVAWNINVAGFEAAGCGVTCHGYSGTEEDSKQAKSGMYTSTDGETYDEWHWKAGRSNALGIAHDKWVGYLDAAGTPADDWDVEAGHHTDGAGIYDHNRNTNKTGPLYFEPNPTDAEDANFIFESEVDNGEAILVKGNEDQLTDGQKIPGRILKDKDAADQDETWDVKAGGKFANGKWTLELKRALTTTDQETKDVQFTDLEAEYAFGVAVFDDGGHDPQHAHGGVLSLGFEHDEVPADDTEDSPGFTIWLVVVGVTATALIIGRRSRR